MNAYNPLESTRRLEAAGLDRAQAEAIASEIGDSKNDLVTTDVLALQLSTLEARLDSRFDAQDTKFEAKLDAALSRQLVRIGVLLAALLTLACTVIGVLISLK